MGEVWEAIIAADALINAETDALEVVAPTSLRIRDAAYGDAYITHAMMLVSTDDVQHGYLLPDGYKDNNGIEVPMITRYSATSSFRLFDSLLPNPVWVPPNTNLAMYAQSETAANSVVVGWARVVYKGKAGQYEQVSAPPKDGGYTQREVDAGGALTSLVAADGTAITSLQANRKYQPVGFSGGSVDGTTAGFVGPAFMKLTGPAEFSGMHSYIPIPNGGNYVAAGTKGFADLKDANISMPKFMGGQNVTPNFISYTAERPIGRVIFAVDKVW